MTITILTLFPGFYDDFLRSSIIGRAVSRGLVTIRIVNIRDYSLDKNHRVDDHPIGGGAGLIMRLEPLMDCLRATTSPTSHRIVMGPKGHTFTQADAERLSRMDDITLICGHYEGIDSRFDNYVDEELSIGDFILTGGEIPAMAITDSIVRLLKGAIADESTVNESFNGSILEYPQYTYPDDYEGHRVPPILYCGNHEAIDEYHRKEALRVTMEKRPDLIRTMTYSKKDLGLLDDIRHNRTSKKEEDAMERGRRFLKDKQEGK